VLIFRDHLVASTGQVEEEHGMSGNGAKVRVASQADYAALGPVFTEAERFHRDALPHVFRPPPGLFPPEPLFRQWANGPHSAVLVADDTGDLVGFVTIRTDSAPAEEILQPRAFAVVDLLAVRSDRQRRGIGRSLMEAAHRWAGQRQLGHVSLNVWEFNQPGISFYQALGYQTVSRRMEHPLPGPPAQDHRTR
jgi:ribosomal protein S18 acetylase RimI-like enzyme